jgi:hypothetical protein
MRIPALVAMVAATAALSACTTYGTPMTRAGANAHLAAATSAGAVCGTYGLMDRNGDGHVSKAEWDAYRTGAYSAWDTDHDGRIDRAEFERCYAANGFYAPKYYNGAYGSNYYSAFDPNKTGYISTDDFFNDRTFDMMDRNHDGMIEGDEWTWSR